MAGLFSSATLERIRAASDIVEVIGAALPLKRAGASFVAVCPFHKEKTPSFHVNPQRQMFHCFGCNKGGDVFAFVREYENITFTEAVRRLAERAHIPVETDEDDGQRERRFLKETLFQIHEAITQRWQTALANDAAGEIARDYLAKRAVPDDAVKLFRLGYAPDAWDDTVNWSKSKGYPLAVVEQAGLIIRKEETDRYYDRFRGRLMFPICDEQGRVIGFSGRVLKGDEKTAKYVNSPETPLFTKGRVFYGLDKAKRAMLDAGRAVICEGQLDLIACHSAGVQNTVAPQGTAFTADHARILKRYVDEAVLCFDSDTAGQSAAVRVQDDLLASGLSIRVVTLPAPHDPDSFIKEFGGARFQELIAQARGFFDFYLDHLCATNDVSTDKGQSAVVRAMGLMVRKSGDQVLADKYAQLTAMKLGGLSKLPVSPDAVRAEFRKLAPIRHPDRARDNVEDFGEDVLPVRELGTKEVWLLTFLFQDDDCVAWLSQHLDLNWIETPLVRDLVVRRLQLHGDGQWRGLTVFLGEIEDSQIRDTILRSVNVSLEEDHFKGRVIPRALDQTKAIARDFRNSHIDRQIAHLEQQKTQPGLSASVADELTLQQIKLRQAKREPLPE